MKKVGLFAYGETGLYALKGLVKDFLVEWIIISPKPDETYQHPVEKYSKSLGIKVLQTRTEKDIVQLLKKTGPDAVVISSYDKILSSKVLRLSKFINVHHGDLPRYRGRANINWAIINNRRKIGLAFHEAVVNLDSGNIYKQFIIKINNNDTVKTVYDKFNIKIEKEIGIVVRKVLEGYKGVPQKGKATYCCTRLPKDGYIDWSKSSKQIYNLIRGLTKPYSGAFTYFSGDKMIIWTAEIPKNSRTYEGRIPGRIASIDKGYGVEVITGDSTLTLKSVQFKGEETNASVVIKSVKNTLGINIVEVYEKLSLLYK